MENQIKILVVDDSLPNRELIKAYFSVIGCTGDYAINGKEAVEMLREGRDYDLCLMDIQMPEMGGLEATKIIRKELSKKLPIIAITAAIMEEDKDKCLDGGMDYFLKKPIDMASLKETIQKFSSKG